MNIPAKTRLSGRVAIVTGASSGLGLAVSTALAQEGAAVVGFARRFLAAALTTSPPPGRVTKIRLNVTDEHSVRERFAEVGPLDILVNCAGHGFFEPVIETKTSDLRSLLDVHIVASFLCARAALRTMRARRSGHIINVSSVAAFRTFRDAGAYSAAKEGLRGLTRVMTEEARAWGVRVTGLYPGAIDTPLWDTRPGFDRAAMLKPESVAAFIVEICARPDLSVEELVVMPPKGAL